MQPSLTARNDSVIALVMAATLLGGHLAGGLLGCVAQPLLVTMPGQPKGHRWVYWWGVVHAMLWMVPGLAHGMVQCLVS
jgi:hypothetical protein